MSFGERLHVEQWWNTHRLKIYTIAKELGYQTRVNKGKEVYKWGVFCSGKEFVKISAEARDDSTA